MARHSVPYVEGQIGKGFPAMILADFKDIA